MEQQVFDTREAGVFLFGPADPAAAERKMVNWRSRHGGPPYRQYGKRTIRYLRSDLEAWMAGTTVEPGRKAEPEPARRRRRQSGPAARPRPGGKNGRLV